MVSFKDQSGKTRHRNTGATNKADAARMVKEAGIEKLEAAAKVSNLTADVIQAIVAGKRVTCKGAADEWVKWRAKDVAANTVRSQEIAVHQFFSELHAQSWSVAKITADHIVDFVNAEDAGKSSNRSSRLHSIRSFFEFCSARGYCVGNPAKMPGVRVRVKDMTVEQRESAKRVPFTKAEFVKIQSNTDGFWKWATALSYWTGLRLVDVCCLEWASIKPDALLVFTRKDEDRIWLPLDNPHIGGTALKNILMEMMLAQASKDKTYCFPDEREVILDPSKRARLSVQFSRLLTKLGIENRTFHCLRHSFATRLKHAGVDIEEIAVHMGHSSSKLTEGVYAH